jgi:hypothetical protein
MQPEEVERAEKYLDRAMGLYKRVLEKSHGNIYAVNGIGCVLGEQGKLKDAKKVLTQVCCQPSCHPPPTFSPRPAA